MRSFTLPPELRTRLRASRRIEEAIRRMRGTQIFRGVEHLRSWNHFGEFTEKHLQVLDMTRELVPLSLNWIQRQLFQEEIRAKAEGRPMRFLILKYRKAGVTTYEQAAAYYTIWRIPHQGCLTLAHRPQDMMIIFQMVDRFYTHQPEEHRHKRTEAFRNWIEFREWDGIYMSGTAGAAGWGRGSTLSRLHLSEAAHYADLRAIMQSLAKSLATNAVYAVESTPNGREGKGEAFHALWQAAKRGENLYTPLFFPWHSNPSNMIRLLAPDELGDLSGEEKELKKKFDLSPEQVKWWRHERMEIVADGRSGWVIHQEHPSDDDTCFLYGSESYYDLDVLAGVEAGCRDPIRVEENGRLRIYEEPKAGNRYVLGIDPAEGKGGDDSAVVGFNIDTGEQAFAWNWNYIRPDDLGSEVLGDRAVGLGWRWKNEATGVPAFLVVERNNHGHATLTALLKQAQYPRGSVYHHIETMKEGAKEQKNPGWPHSPVGHVFLQNTLGRVLREKAPKIRDLETLRSIRAVTTAGTGGAEFGGRDLAVGVALAALGLAAASEVTGWVYMGGQMVNLLTGETKPLQDER